MTRRLTLTSEHLTELTTDELTGVVAAAQTNDGLCAKLSVTCMTCPCPSINAPCPTK